MPMPRKLPPSRGEAPRPHAQTRARAQRRVAGGVVDRVRIRLRPRFASACEWNRDGGTKRLKRRCAALGFYRHEEGRTRVHRRLLRGWRRRFRRRGLGEGDESDRRAPHGGVTGRDAREEVVKGADGVATFAVKQPRREYPADAQPSSLVPLQFGPTRRPDTRAWVASLQTGPPRQPFTTSPRASLPVTPPCGATSSDRSPSLVRC